MDKQISNSAKDGGEGHRLFEAFLAANTEKLEFDLEKLPARTDFEARELSGGITYLRFDRFESLDLVGKVLDAIDAAGPAGLIVDLHRNPGGLQLHLHLMAGVLLGDDATLGHTHRANSRTELKSWRITDHYTGPLVVLIGPSTGSTAEITAAAVQDHARGVLIGRMSSGVVVAGQWFDLPDGGRIMVPVSDFVRSDGRRIEGVGVEPDIRVLPTLDDVRAGRDPVLERAIVELRRRSARAPDF